MLSLKIVIGKKSIIPNGNINTKILIANVISFILTYILFFEFDILVVILFILGGIFPFIYSKNKFNKSIYVNDTNTTEKTNLVNGNNIEHTNLVNESNIKILILTVKVKKQIQIHLLQNIKWINLMMNQ